MHDMSPKQVTADWLLLHAHLPMQSMTRLAHSRLKLKGSVLGIL